MPEVDPEKKFHSIMDKLLHAPKPKSSSAPISESGVQSSRGQKRANPTYASAFAMLEPNKRTENVNGSQRFAGADLFSQRTPSCRPWDRGDLMKRMATFKSMTWFGRPKVVDAVNCARRGWVNVDMDIIGCESCGARLLFSTPSSWSQQQVEKAASMFSLRLDNGHKSSCPWIDNSCNEKLARFPPMTDLDLMHGYKQRIIALSQLLSLPIILISAINHLKSPQFNHFLQNETPLQSIDGCGNELREKNMGIDINSESGNKYYEAQKIISLCGWEPRLLPYVVDWDNQSTPLHESGIYSNLSEVTPTGQEFSVYSITEDLVTRTNALGASHGQCLDPNSIVLECKFCGASVGLWAFSKIPRTLECCRFVGYSEVDGQNGSESAAAPPSSDFRFSSHTAGGALDGATVLGDQPTNLKATVAGGPLATNQNFRAKVSLPAIGKILRIRLLTDLGLGSLAPPNPEGSQSNMTLPSSLEIVASPATDHPLIEGEDVTGKGPQVTGGQYIKATSFVKSKSFEEVSMLGSEDTVSKVSHVFGVSVTDDLSNKEKRVAQDSVLVGGTDNVACGTGMKTNTEEETIGFDPIRQHRHFCPWIISTCTSSPGWKQVLSAWHRQKGSLMSSSFEPAPSSKLIEVDDPISSIRRLFASPSPKRRKLMRGSS